MSSNIFSDIFTVGEFLLGTDTKTDKGNHKDSSSIFDLDFNFGSDVAKSDKSKLDLGVGALAANKQPDFVNLMLSDGSLNVKQFII